MGPAECNGWLRTGAHGADRPGSLGSAGDHRGAQGTGRPGLGRVLSGGISNPLEVIEQITYLLFIRRLDDLLKPGGRAAVIVPDGVLFGSSKAHKELRRLLIE